MAAVKTAVPAKNSQTRKDSDDNSASGLRVGRTLAFGAGSSSLCASRCQEFSSPGSSHQGKATSSDPSESDSLSVWVQSWEKSSTGASAGGALRSEEVPQTSSARAPPHLVEEPLPSFLGVRPFFPPFAGALFWPLLASGQTVNVVGGTVGFPLPEPLLGRAFFADL